MIFFGLSYSVQDLGLQSVNYNGIFFGITQAVGYLTMVPFVHKMPRKLWSIIFQSSTLVGVAILTVLSFYDDSDFIRIMRLAVSTLILTVVNSAQFPIFFSSLAELFPSKLRGTSNAIILFLSKLAGSFSPYLSTIAKNNGFHIMCGCCLLSVIALPVTFFQTETLVINNNGRRNKSDDDTGLDDSDKTKDEGDDDYSKIEEREATASLFGTLLSGNNSLDLKFGKEGEND